MSADEPPRPNFPGSADAIEFYAPIKDNIITVITPIIPIEVKNINKDYINSCENAPAEFHDISKTD
jgi:hypothetical protein